MANTHKALSTVTVGAGGGASSIDFTNIPQTYTDLVIRLSARGTSSGAEVSASLQFNNSTSNYSSRWLRGSGSTASTGLDTYDTDEIYLFEINGNSSTATTFQNGLIYISNYTSSSYKSVSVDSVTENNATSAWAYSTGGLWSNNAAITSVKLLLQGGTFAQYTTATLYGVFNADVSTAPAVPTIGTATAVGKNASVTFTGVSNAASYVMTSSPGSLTGTGASSPILVSGLADNTSYTFSVQSQNPFGLSSASAASNSITTTTAGWENLGSYTGTTPTVTFSSIPSTYQHLAILYSIRTSEAGGGANEGFWIRVNSLAGTNYGEMNITSSPANAVNSSQGVNQDSWGAFATPGATTTSGTWGYGIIYIYNYADANAKKSYSTQNGYFDVTNTAYYWQNFAVGAVNLTSAIDTIRLQSGNYRTWATGSRVSLYGIRGS